MDNAVDTTATAVAAPAVEQDKRQAACLKAFDGMPTEKIERLAEAGGVKALAAVSADLLIQLRKAKQALDEKRFVNVPETTLPGGLVVPAFQVAKYLASKGADGKLMVAATGSPLINVSYHEARELAAQAGYALITETQALSLAWNLSQVAANWISGVVGEGSMYQGLHLDLDDADEPYPFDFVSRDPSERRAFFLADGSAVIDAAGNAYTWVFDDVQGDERGVVARAFAADSPSITTAPFPSMQKGMGWQPKAGSDWSRDALIRGGRWCSLGDAGVFCLYRVSPDSGYSSVGVRCTKPVGL